MYFRLNIYNISIYLLKTETLNLMLNETSDLSDSDLSKHLLKVLNIKNIYNAKFLDSTFVFL